MCKAVYHALPNLEEIFIFLILLPITYFNPLLFLIQLGLTLHDEAGPSIHGTIPLILTLSLLLTLQVNLRISFQ